MATTYFGSKPVSDWTPNGSFESGHDFINQINKQQQDINAKKGEYSTQQGTTNQAQQTYEDAYKGQNAYSDLYNQAQQSEGVDDAKAQYQKSLASVNATNSAMNNLPSSINAGSNVVLNASQRNAALGNQMQKYQNTLDYQTRQNAGDLSQYQTALASAQDLAKTNMSQEQTNVAQAMQNYQAQMNQLNELYNQVLNEKNIMRQIYGDMYDDEYKHMQQEIEVWAQNLGAETQRYAQDQETARNNARIAADKYAADAGLRLQQYLQKQQQNEYDNSFLGWLNSQNGYNSVRGAGVLDDNGTNDYIKSMYNRYSDATANNDARALNQIMSGETYGDYLKWRRGEIVMATPLFNAQELAVAGLEENKNRYQDLKNRAEKSASTYDWNLFDPKTYGNFGNWLANGVSGGGWTHKGRMEKAGFTDDMDNYGKEGLLSSYDLGNLEGQYTGSMRNRTNQLEAGKGLFSGVPVIGGLLSAPAQAVSAGKDFFESGTSKWDSGKRDAVSDIGAIGETALDLATLGTGAGAKTALGTIGKGAALGAGYGLTGGLNEMGKDTDLGTLALQTGLGGAIGGGIAGLGYGAGKLWNKYAKGSPSKELALYNGGNAQGGAYQDALNTLKGAGLDTTSPETLNKSFKKWVVQNHPDKGGSTELFQSVSGAKKLYQDALNGKASATASQVANAGPVRQSLGQQFRNFAGNIPNMRNDLANSKLGNRVSSLLKTRAGKVGAGVGGGLLLASLLRGGGNSQDELTDEELMQLYNYYGGGQ